MGFKFSGMVNDFSSLTLNGRLFGRSELIDFCRSEILRADIPGWECEICRFILDWLSDETFIIIRTSGSTGIPKIIHQPKVAMINSALMTKRYFGLSERTNALLCLPVSYIAGKMMIVRSFVSRMNLVTVEPSSNPLLQVKDKIDFAAITPFQLAHFMGTLNEKKIQTLIVGGGEIPYDLELQCQKVTSNIFATYGMTETSSHIALRAVNGPNRSLFYEVLNNIKISVDQRNCLVVKAPDLTPELLTTNDVVAIKDSTHFEWLGRFDSVINSGGIKIFPEQVEKKLFPVISRRFFLAGLPDGLLGEMVALFVEGEPFGPEEQENLGLAMASLVTRFELPRRIVSIPTFDLSDAGKILKKLIVTNYLNG